LKNVRCSGSVANFAHIQKSKMGAIHNDSGLQIMDKLKFQKIFIVFYHFLAIEYG